MCATYANDETLGARHNTHNLSYIHTRFSAFVCRRGGGWRRRARAITAPSRAAATTGVEIDLHTILPCVSRDRGETDRQRVTEKARRCDPGMDAAGVPGFSQCRAHAVFFYNCLIACNFILARPCFPHQYLPYVFQQGCEVPGRFSSFTTRSRVVCCVQQWSQSHTANLLPGGAGGVLHLSRDDSLAAPPARVYALHCAGSSTTRQCTEQQDSCCFL